MAVRCLGRVAHITFTNPKKLNPMTEAVGKELRAAVQALDRKATSVIVLNGEGENFSAGGDLDFLRARAASTPEQNIDTMVSFYNLFLGPLRASPFVTIAAVTGAAVGAGAALATACDMRVVASTAKVGWTFTSGVAIHPGMGSTFFLPKAVGQQNANRLLLGGELLSGRQLAAMGWALEAVDDTSAVLPRAVSLAETVAATAPAAMRETLLTLRARDDEGLQAALQREAEGQAVCYAGPDFLKGLDAIVSRKKPVWGQYED